MAAPTTSMTIGGGVTMLRSQYLAGFKETAEYPTVPQLDDKADATFDGTIDELAVAHPDLTPALYNDVKICKQCGKPNAFTMKACNSCGADLEFVPITKSENVFAAFLFGVKRAGKGFPYTISVRRQTPEVLVFDDMLSLCPIHLNGIPTKYIPDWRFLLTSPRQALKLLDLMESELWEATKPFLENAGFRQKVLCGNPSDDDIKGKVIKSFNYPPSQFQMHIQWLVPPMAPFHHYMAEIRNHFHEDRAFPLTYVRKVLELDVPYEVKRNTPIEEIVEFYAGKGVVYKEYWNAFYEKCLQDSIELSNWNASDFQYVVENGKVHELTVVEGKVVAGAEVSSSSAAEIQAKDKAALQCYGRPYNEGKPTGTYIKVPLKPQFGGPGGFGKWPGVSVKVPSKPVHIDPAPEGTTEMKVTAKRGNNFYSRAAINFLKGVEAREAENGKEPMEAKPAVETLRISGLGDAVGVAVTAASYCVSQGAGTIIRTQTASVTMENSDRDCPQIFIDLKRCA